MAGFFRSDRVLTCDGVPLAEVAGSTGTPVHVYSAALIAERYRALDAACGDYPHRLHYAIKANSTLAVVRLLRELGASADANSAGEIEVARRAGFAPPDIVLTGVGKTADELEQAVALGVAAINAESLGEVDRIAAIAGRRGTVARLAIRINPDVDALSHPGISTGRAVNKFGVPVQQAQELTRAIQQQPQLRLVGLHMHIGSQITATAPIAAAARVLVDLATGVRARGVALEHLDLGGGLGIAYRQGEPTLDVEAYTATLLPIVRESGLTLLLEPGRWLVGPAGALVTRVVDQKAHFVIVDAGMTDLLRPALYDAWHEIDAVAPRAGDPVAVDVVGPVCESTDTVGRARLLPPVAVGDLLAVRDTGAYGSVMASNYNRRPTAAEVMVTAEGWQVVRRRQTVADMLQWESDADRV